MTPDNANPKPETATPYTGGRHRVYDSSSLWRCSHPHHRLHRDDNECTDSPPSSPIIDTPSKRERMERRNAALLGNSQATQSTPSRPSRSRLRTQTSQTPEGSVAPEDVQQDDNDHTASDDEGEVENDGYFPNFDHANTNPTSSSNADQQSSDHQPQTPVQQPSDRVPETPGVAYRSSPPLPTLTADNLSLLQDQAAAASSTPPSVSASPAPAPSVWSLPSHIAHQISRLALRARINSAHYLASEAQLATARGDLAVARTRVQHEAARGKVWRNALGVLLGLCLAYVVWCWCNSAEFAFIEEGRRRKWYGL